MSRVIFQSNLKCLPGESLLLRVGFRLCKTQTGIGLCQDHCGLYNNRNSYIFYFFIVSNKLKSFFFVCGESSNKKLDVLIV